MGTGAGSAREAAQAAIDVHSWMCTTTLPAPALRRRAAPPSARSRLLLPTLSSSALPSTLYPIDASDSSPFAMSAAMLAPMSTLRRNAAGGRGRGAGHRQRSRRMWRVLQAAKRPAGRRAARAPALKANCAAKEPAGRRLQPHLQSSPSSLRTSSLISCGPSDRTRMPCGAGGSSQGAMLAQAMPLAGQEGATAGQAVCRQLLRQPQMRALVRETAIASLRTCPTSCFTCTEHRRQQREAEARVERGSRRLVRTASGGCLLSSCARQAPAGASGPPHHAVDELVRGAETQHVAVPAGARGEQGQQVTRALQRRHAAPNCAPAPWGPTRHCQVVLPLSAVQPQPMPPT